MRSATRHKNPLMTLVLLMFLGGFGWASWHFLVEERVFANDSRPTPPASEIERLRRLCHEALLSDDCYDGITSFNWRENGSRYRVDVQIRDGCTQQHARAIARRLSELVERATDGYPAEVGVLVLGRELWHFVP